MTRRHVRFRYRCTQVFLLSAAAGALAGCGFLSLPLGIGVGPIFAERIVATDPPDATTPITFPLATDFTDGLGFRWDIEDDGHVTDGGIAGFPDAFDQFMVIELRVHGFSEHEFEPPSMNALLEDDREIVIGPYAQEGGLSITRKIYISPTHGFCRWLDIFENTSDADLVVESENRGNLGSDEDSNDEVFASSTGDTLLGEGDLWWINGQQFASDPTVAAFFCGTKDTEKDHDSIVLDYGMNMMIPAHTRFVLPTFLFQRVVNPDSDEDLLSQEVGIVDTLADFLRSFESFPAVDSAYLVGMTAAEVNDIRNCGGNVRVSGGAGALAGSVDYEVANVTRSRSRTGTSNPDGSFLTNIVGQAGDEIQVYAAGQTFAVTVP
ncbi:MAG: hypothetical protein U1A27_04145 [Phycisphaerae bacterium]